MNFHDRLNKSLTTLAMGLLIALAILIFVRLEAVKIVYNSLTWQQRVEQSFVSVDRALKKLSTEITKYHPKEEKQ